LLVTVTGDAFLFLLVGNIDTKTKSINDNKFYCVFENRWKIKLMN
jgi:hypothetical protein